MNKNESVIHTLKYLEDLNKRSTTDANFYAPEISAPTSTKLSIKNESKSSNKKVIVKDAALSSAEPHLKKLASMLNEELANNKRKKEEEAEKLRKEELERIRFEESERVRLELERVRLEESEKVRLELEKIEKEKRLIELEEEKERIKLQEAERLRIELEKIEEEKTLKLLEIEKEKSRLQEENKISSNTPTLTETKRDYVSALNRAETNKIKESTLVDKPEVDPYISKFGNKKNLKEQADFVTFEDLKKHYTDFLNKINIQLGSLGGGGEVLMKRLDDLDMATVQDGDFISFDAASGKFIGGSIEPGSGIIEGGSY
jgi:hypothetical protein